MKTFADLGLPLMTGLGAWSETVDAPDWAVAEDALVTSAQEALQGPLSARVGGYYAFKDTKNNRLTLNLMRGTPPKKDDQ
jgi:hypothetical protein